MKARIRSTGEEIVVKPYGDEFAQILPDGDYKVYIKQELMFPDEFDWKQVRIQFISAALTGLLANPDSILNHESIVETLLKISDALVAELKRSDDVHAECLRMDAINTASVCENMTKIQKELQKKRGQDDSNND